MFPPGDSVIAPFPPGVTGSRLRAYTHAGRDRRPFPLLGTPHASGVCGPRRRCSGCDGSHQPHRRQESRGGTRSADIAIDRLLRRRRLVSNLEGRPDVRLLAPVAVPPRWNTSCCHSRRFRAAAPWVSWCRGRVRPSHRCRGVAPVFDRVTGVAGSRRCPTRLVGLSRGPRRALDRRGRWPG